MNESTRNATIPDGAERGGLLAWQWSLHRDGHADRRNLLVHALTVPLFVAGSAAAVLSPLTGWIALAGVALMFAAIALQGRSHRLERTRPVPFRSRADLMARLFAEQWVTFPRFVLTGGFARAWRAAAR